MKVDKGARRLRAKRKKRVLHRPSVYVYVASSIMKVDKGARRLRAKLKNGFRIDRAFMYAVLQT